MQIIASDIKHANLGFIRCLYLELQDLCPGQIPQALRDAKEWGAEREGVFLVKIAGEESQCRFTPEALRRRMNCSRALRGMTLGGIREECEKGFFISDVLSMSIEPAQEVWENVGFTKCVNVNPDNKPNVDEFISFAEKHGAFMEKDVEGVSERQYLFRMEDPARPGLQIKLTVGTALLWFESPEDFSVSHEAA